MNDIENLGINSAGSIGSKMPHSHSTPAGVDGGSRTPPATPRKAGKMLAVRVQMLDDTVTMFQVQAKALGRVLFDQVCKQLNLLEADYFGLEYQELNGTKYWLDLEKPVCRQVGLTLVDPLLRFCVKFYTPDPAQLEEEFTRYLYCLQIKRDLAQGSLQCNDNTAALMASYIVQAECGDYVIEDYPDHTYLSTYKFIPHQDMELERRIMENHKKHAGQSPAEADLNLLETARRCELYGMKMHSAKDHEGVPLNLAVAHMGIVVFQNYTKINTFSWAKIRKISFKRKRFLIKLHPEGYGYYKDTVEFFFEGRNECKNFWKKCVENHGFFRCSTVKHVVRQKTRVLSRGSSFRYSGKTQKQIVEFVRDNYVKRQTFHRSNSFRQTSGGRALQGSEGGGYRGATPSSSLMGSSSISAHPLLPLGDPVLGTPALSLSCGSMTLDSPTTATSVSMGGTTDHRREDTATSFRTLTSIDIHSPATPSLAPAPLHHLHASSQQRISTTGRISPSNSSPLEFPPPRPLPRHPWQRSASCRDLYASSFEDSGKSRSRNGKNSTNLPLEPFQLPSQGELDKPVTRYDETNRSYSAASSKLPSLDHDPIPDKVYSSSYPGTSSLSTESGHEESGPAGDLSHDDLSHDSYELLEREHEFEYPESDSSPRDEPASENSDEGIEHELFEMDSETDAFVKHKSVKSSDRQHFKSMLADIKCMKKMATDWYPTAPRSETEIVQTESKTQRSNTQVHRKFETMHVDVDSLDQQAVNIIHHFDPIITQVQKQKVNLLNELKNFKQKTKITHVDSEVLRDEGIMRPKSRIDDDLSSVDQDKYISGRGIRRTTRAKSIASLDDRSPRLHIETGSLGRGHRSRERKTRETEAKMEKLLSKMQEKERRSIEKEERKRIERENSREARRLEKSDFRERRSMDRSDSHVRKSMERLDLREHNRRRDSIDRSGSRESRNSSERLDCIERSYERVDSIERNRESRCRSIEHLDLQKLHNCIESVDDTSSLRSFKDKLPSNRDAKKPDGEIFELNLDSREACRMHAVNTVDYNQRHTLERFDSGNRSPFERLGLREPRGKSVERIDSPGHLAFDFDIKAIECLRSHDRSVLDHSDSKDRHREMKSFERLSSKERRHIERKSLEKIDSRELRSLDHLDVRDNKSSEHFDRQNSGLKGSADTLDTRESKKGKVTNADGNPPERGKSEEKPRERDDWKSLEKARKDDERRERERQAVLTSQFPEFRSESVTGIPEEKTKGSVFAEYDPMIVGGVVLGFDDTALPIHNPVERTKSDPNPARQRLGSNSKRHMLTHQKSIDLTPADSGDEDAFLEGTRTQKCNVDIPYTLHKRHVMNGTASDEKSESENGKTSKNGVKKLAKDLLKLPLKSVADLSSLDMTKLISLEEGTTLSPKRPKSILISPDKVKSSSSVSGKNKSLSSPVSKISPTDQKMIVSNATPPDKSPVKSGIKPSSNSQASSRSLSLDKIGSKSVTKDRLTVNSKSTSLDKKSSKLLPTEPNAKVVSSIEKKSYTLSPTESHLVIVSAVEKRKSPIRVPKSSNSGKLCNQTDLLETSQPEEQPSAKLMDIVGLQIKQKLERREKEKLNVPDDSLEKQDSIENVPLPEIPLKVIDSVEPPLPTTQRLAEELDILDKQMPSPQKNPAMQSVYVDQSSRAPMEIISSECEENGKRDGEDVETERQVKVFESEFTLMDKSKLLEKSRLYQKPSIPEKTKRILDKIESKFTEINKNSNSKLSKPMIIDTGFDDFVDPVADLPLDEVPVKPALDSLKVPEFTTFISRPHAEPLRCKSLSLAEEKAPIDTLLSPELESKSFVQDMSPKKSKLTKSDAKKDFKKQSKSLEGDKPSLKKTASKELKTSPANSKVGKSKLKIGEMPQEIIIIDSTDVEPEISIVQKGRSKSVTRLSDRSFSTSKDEKDEFKKSRVKSTSVDDELIKGPGNSKNDKTRPKFLGISKSLGSTEKKDSTEKVSPKRVSSVKGTSKSEYCQGARLMKAETDMPRPVVNNEVRASLINSEAKSVTDVGERKTVSENSVKKYQNNQEMCQSSTIMRKQGQVPILFARARLGLSEGSGLGTLQRQGATQSLTAQRRAKSLDAPVISVHRLPPTNAFSSKDDTVDTNEELAEQEIVSDENLESQQVFKSPQSLQMEASPNHKSESTDHTTLPEMLTDSLSVTETSAQYLESPLTECNEIVICPDLIPYEQESQVQSVHLYNSREISVTDRKIDNFGSTTKFIDQSSIESGAEVEALQENAQPKGSLSGSDIPVSNMPYQDKHSASIFELNSKIEFTSGSDSWNTGSRDWNHERKASPQHYKNAAYNSDTLDENKEEPNDTSLKMQTIKAHQPYIESTSGIQNMSCTVDTEKKEFIPGNLKFSQDTNTDTVKAFIQISIEECSDDEIVIEPDNSVATDTNDIHRRKPRLDSGDTSEDTLDALESQVRGGDSEVSSPDYGVEKVDEKTLVEVQLTPEYLEMKKEDEKAIEELPEDDPFPTETKEATDSNRLPVERKLRLSTERSGSEETNTWTPDREDPDSSSCSIARPLGIGRVQSILDRREITVMKETRKDGSQEEESSSSSFPIHKPELSSTWKPFPLESSGSSSLEDGWFPPDDSSNHHQSHSEDSNGQNEDSFQEDLIDFPAGFGYPMGPDILANYGGAFCLSRTLSRISERSTTSEQDKSEMEDSFKPSSRSPSLDDESLISSDHQPSLSSDPPSGTALPSVSDDRRTSSELPDIPIDVINGQEDEDRSPNVKSRLQLQASEEWPSPPSSPLFDTPVVSHVETFYMEIKPEEAVKVTVTDSTDTPDNIGNDTDSSDENKTLHDDLHSALLEDGQSSMSATTVDGTVKITVKPKSNSYITGSSHSEDTSMGLSMSEWSSSNNTVRQFCQYSGTKSDDNSLAELGASISDWSGSTTIVPQQYYVAVATEKSQSDTTTSDKSITSMRPNSRCRHVDSSSTDKGDVTDLDGVRFGNKQQQQQQQQQQSQLELQDISRCQFADGSYGDAIEFDDSMRYSEVRNYEAAQFDEARKFVESQFDKHQFDDSQYQETDIPRPIFTDISPPQMTFRNAYDESIREFNHMTDSTQITDIPGPIPEESEEQLYDNVPAMKYSSGDQVRMEVTRGDSSEDMHERYASLASCTRYEYDRSIDDQQTLEEKLQKRFHEKSFNKFERGYSEPGIELRHGTKSTQRPVVVPIRAKSTPYYSTTSLSGESTTSSPPMQMKAQIRTKTMAYSSSRSPQSEGDTSSSMDSPGHTPERGARAFRRKRQQNIKRRHRVAVDLELKDEQIVSSTDSSFDVANIPPPLLPEQSLDIDDEELFVTGNHRHHHERNPE